MEVSVIIPIYNAEKYLEETLQDIQKQSFQDFEVLLVDDASTDGSLVMAKQFCHRDSRFRLLENKRNMGAAYSRNRGLAEASGKFVMFLDSDDNYDPAMFATLYRNIVKYNADVVMCNANIIDQRTGERREFGQWRRLQPYLCETGVWVVDDLKEREGASGLVDMVAWNKLIRREWLQTSKIEFQDLPSYNDLYFSMAVTLLAKRVVFIRDTFVDYYQFRIGSITEQRGWKHCGIVKAYAALLQVDAIRNSRIASELRNRAMHNMLAIALADHRSNESKVQLLREISFLYESDWKAYKTNWDPICAFYLTHIQNMNENELADINPWEYTVSLVLELLTEKAIVYAGNRYTEEAEMLKKRWEFAGKMAEVKCLHDEPDAFYITDGNCRYERKQVCL